MNTLEQLRTGQLTGTRRLTLACDLQTFPREIFDLADTLEILDLSGNALCELPDDLPRLHKLRILFCSNNQFTTLPEVLGRCGQLSMVGFKANQIHTVPGNALPATLRWLILTDNQIEELPSDIGRCMQMQKLMLSGNQLQTLPPTLAACTQLELLRISANRLTELPAFLLTLPRLAWLAYAGNPFCVDLEATTQPPIAHIPWAALTLQHPLGEGASGIIHQAQWRGGVGTQAVAVKLFKGTVTSDGLPQSEMTACISAGAHPHLIPVLGRVLDHPEGTLGMVMALIDPGFVTLAAPPSLASCTRDIYAADTLFDVNTALLLALGVASAARHLHAQGLMHGDLYAHNVLHSSDGSALLGDFGAASFLAPENPLQALALQRLEVRAFACLLEELVARCAPQADSTHALRTLADLASACLHANPPARPLFDEIEQILTALAYAQPA